MTRVNFGRVPFAYTPPEGFTAFVPLDLDAMAAAARQRVAAFVARSAAQHLRAMRKSWEPEIAARVAQLPVPPRRLRRESGESLD